MSEQCKHCGRTIVLWGGDGKLWVHKDDDHAFCSMDDDDNNDRAEPSPEPEAALPEKSSEDSWAIADRLGDKIMDDFMDAEPRQAIDDLLNRFVEVYREVPLRGSMIEPGVRLWRDYYKLTGDHMILTDEGWEPGEAKQSYVDQLEPGELVSSVILDEVNAPHQPKRRKERALSGEFSAGVVEPSPEPEAAPDTSQNSPETWDRPDLDYPRAPGISADRDRESDAQSGNPWYPTDEPHLAVHSEAAPVSEAQAPAVPDVDGISDKEKIRVLVAAKNGMSADLKRGEEMYIAMRDRCAHVEAELGALREKLATMSSRAIDVEEHVIPALREKLEQAERKGWNGAIEAVVELLKRIPNRDLAIAGIRALAKGEKG